MFRALVFNLKTEKKTQNKTTTNIKAKQVLMFCVVKSRSRSRHVALCVQKRDEAVGSRVAEGAAAILEGCTRACVSKYAVKTLIK